MTELSAAPEYAEPSAEWHRLDVRMLVLQPLSETLALAPVFISLIVMGGGSLLRIAISLGSTGVLVLFSLVKWIMTRYRITDEQVELRTGLFVRKHLTVPRDRIRTVDLTSKLWHRLFGLSVIRVGTGQSGKSKLTLNAVSSKEAERLRVVVDAAR